MLSILIPIYNFDIQILVHDLLHQARQLHIPFEILIEDDASTQEGVCSGNYSLVAEPEVTYFQNVENKGRARVLNHLVAAANYPNLLFLDANAGMKHSNFISQYVQYVRIHSAMEKPFVVSGGVAYRDMIPDANYRLRWKYGLVREQKTAATRNINPYRSFTSFNLLIEKSVFQTCRFDEDSDVRCFVDTFFGEQLRKNKIPVTHIDNEMYLDGLDTNEGYLAQVERNLDNLHQLVQEGKANENFVQNNRLLTTFFRLKKLHCVGLVGFILKLLKPVLRYFVLQTYSIRALDLYKLYYYCERSQ